MNNDNVLDYIVKMSFKPLFKQLIMLPIYTKIVPSYEELNSNINIPILKYPGPVMGFYFQNQTNNEFRYNISFHTLMVKKNSEIWKE